MLFGGLRGGKERKLMRLMKCLSFFLFVCLTKMESGPKTFPKISEVSGNSEDLRKLCNFRKPLPKLHFWL